MKKIYAKPATEVSETLPEMIISVSTIGVSGDKKDNEEAQVRTDEWDMWN